MKTAAKMLAAALLATTATSAMAETYFYRNSMSAPAPAISASVGSAAVRPGAAVSLPLSASNGAAPFTWKVDGTLPSGVSLSGDRISGSSTSKGVYPFTVTGTDRMGSKAAAQGRIEILDAVGVTGPTTLSARVGGTTGVAVYAATGALGTVAWSTSPSLPAGLSVNATGRVVGTATAAFNGSVKVVATDGSDGAKGETGVAVRAVAAPTVSGSSVSVNQGSSVSQSYTAGNLLGSATWTTEGTVPAGLWLNASTGLLSGTASAAQSGSFVAKVTDSFDGAQASYTVNYTVTAVTVAKWTYSGTRNVGGASQNYPMCGSIKNVACPSQVGAATWCRNDNGSSGFGDLLFCQ